MNALRPIHVISLFVVACGGADKGTSPIDTGTDSDTPTVDTDPGTTTGDLDGDGFSEDDGDCNDSDAAAYPGALEICDGVDNDCNGLSDELASAATLDGTVNYPTIQEALDAATQNSSILVCDGLWGGPIHIATTITLSSVSGQYDCTIDGQSQDSVITVTAPDVKITGVTVTGGLAASGGGINGVNAERLKVESSIITLNNADFGGGIYLGADSEVLATIITQNDAISYGGGIAVRTGVTATATNATVEDNDARLGGGAFLYEGAILNALGVSTFSDNTAESGGGVYVWGVGGGFSGGQIEGNDAIWGGGLYFYDGGEVADVVVYGNTGAHGGGAMVHGLVTLDNVPISTNHSDGEGGGVIVQDGSLFCLGTTDVDNNTADDIGGGAMIENGAITDCKFAGNEVINSGGGIVALGDFTLTDVVVRNNVSDTRAGGIYVNGPHVGTILNGEIDGNASDSYGGGIYVNNGGDVSVDGTLITDNTSELGAGIYVSNASIIALTNATVEDNGDVATNSGGGARISASNGGSDLISTNTSWGSGPLDNSPDDVVAGLTQIPYSGYEANETFSCDESACTPGP